MKENIYSKNTPTKLVIKQLLFITGSLLITTVLPAQHQSAHNIRSVKPNFSNNNYSIQGTVTTVKSLSVLNSVTPGENSVSGINTNNRSDIYSPSSSSTSNNARIIGNSGYPGNDGSINNVGSINNDGLLITMAKPIMLER